MEFESKLCVDNETTLLKTYSILYYYACYLITCLKGSVYSPLAEKNICCQTLLSKFVLYELLVIIKYNQLIYCLKMEYTV